MKHARLVVSLAALTALLLMASEGWSALIGHWQMDEGSGTTTADSSGNGYTGTFTGSPAWVAGVSGNALDFDGSDDGLDTTGTSTLGVGFSAISFAAWFNADSIPSGPEGSDGIVLKPYFTDNNELSYYLGVYSGQVIGTVETSGGAASLAAGGVSLDTWYHAAVTYDGATAKLYLNGSLADSEPLTGTVYGSGTQYTLDIGYRYLSWGGGSKDALFDGTIDDVRIYNSALTQEEITALIAPEPTSVVLLGLGGLLTGLWARSRRT